jgi:alpha-tubulin suppressor-like RCC1 family protein
MRRALAAVLSATGCALLGNGTVKCRGSNQRGTLGTARRGLSTIPVTVAGIANAKSLALALAACVVLSSGQITCWGGNRFGELGAGTQTKDSALPLVVKGLP